jgi:hypothetical protein
VQTVVGNFQITLTVTILKIVGSTNTQIAQSSHVFNWPSGLAAGTQNTIQHAVATDLETYGPGTFQVRQETTAVCNGQTIPVNPNPIYSSAISVSRPLVKVTGVPSATQWSFWYLGGAPTIDGYYVEVALQGDDNTGVSIGSREWVKVDQPNKISLSTTSGSTTLVSSQAASNSATYDISLVYKIDGFSSAKFKLHVNRPHHIDDVPFISHYPQDDPAC